MARLWGVGLILVAAIAAIWLVRRGHEPPPPSAPATSLPASLDPALQLPGASLLEGLGNYRFAVTSSPPDVQRWFDQGLMLTYGFNHDAAERSFLKALALDPQYAMCWWGAPHAWQFHDVPGFASSGHSACVPEHPARLQPIDA